MAIVVAVVALTSGFIYFCFRWWWPAAASRGCGFAKKGRERERNRIFDV